MALIGIFEQIMGVFRPEVILLIFCQDAHLPLYVFFRRHYSLLCDDFCISFDPYPKRLEIL